MRRCKRSLFSGPDQIKLYGAVTCPSELQCPGEHDDACLYDHECAVWKLKDGRPPFLTERGIAVASFHDLTFLVLWTAVWFVTALGWRKPLVNIWLERRGFLGHNVPSTSIGPGIVSKLPPCDDAGAWEWQEGKNSLAEGGAEHTWGKDSFRSISR